METAQIESLHKVFTDYLKKKKQRLTTEREAIFNKVCNFMELFTLEVIWQELDKENFHVSRASVYNTIKLMMDAKIVVCHQFTNSLFKYELSCVSEGFIYIICNECETVSKLQDEKLTRYCAAVKTPKFTREYYALYFHGLCSKCKYRLATAHLRQNDNK
ncbi:MAG: transcriptional repressor [Tannerella sp.]|jgi:Fur family ferric uptake transcriptional regulator|nr:transcriptional repressor [Tannerella sp.]